MGREDSATRNARIAAAPEKSSKESAAPDRNRLKTSVKIRSWASEPGMAGVETRQPKPYVACRWNEALEESMALESAAKVAKQLIGQHGLAAPSLAMETAQQKAREGDLIGCREWVRIKLAAEQIIAEGRQAH
jgi:hypothetical protein